MHWVSVHDRLPEKEGTVLAWYGAPSFSYVLCCLDEDGNWQEEGTGEGATPTHWMPLPEPPGTPELAPSPVAQGEVVGDRLVLDIREQKETVASLMQRFIDGRPAIINGEQYLVVDMTNEMIADEHVSSVFCLKKIVE